MTGNQLMEQNFCPPTRAFGAQRGVTKTKNVVSLAALVLAFMAVAAPAQANDHWWQVFYMGAGAGAGRFESSLQQLDVMPVPATTPAINNTLESTSFNQTVIASKFFAGYRILKYLAIEGGYFNFHDLEAHPCFLFDSTGECSDVPGELPDLPSERVWTVDVPLDGWTAYAVGLLPFNDTVEGFLKVGAVNWKALPSAHERIVGGFIPCNPTATNPDCSPGSQSPAPTNPPVDTRRFEGTDLALGIGVNFNTESGISVRTEGEWYDIGIADRTWMLSLSVIYNFGGNLVK
jgi:opacity protein-like surface antigen